MNSPLLASTPQKKSPWKKTAGIAGICLLSLGVLAGFAPTILSTSWGASYLARNISEKIKGKLQLQSLSLSWLGTQEIEGISYSDNTGAIFASCERITTDASLFSILLGGHQIGDLNILSPHLKIKKEFVSYHKPSSTHIADSSLVYIPPITPQLQKTLFPFTGRVQIKEGSIDVTAGSIEPVSIYGIESSAFFAKDKSRISFSLQAQSMQQEQIGDISIGAEMQDLHTINPRVILQSSMSKLPIKAIDQIISIAEPSYKGLFIDTLGKDLSLQMNATFSRTSIELQMSAQSEHLQADIATVSNDSEITLKAPAAISLQLSPALIQRYATGFKPSGDLNLAMTISELILPMSDTGVNLQQMQVHAQIESSLLPFKDSSIGPITAELDSKALGSSLTFALNAPIQNPQGQAQIKVGGQATGLLTASASAFATIQMEKVPTALIDIISSSPYASVVLGPSIDAKAKIEHTNGMSHLYFSVDTPTLTINNAHFSFDGALELQEPFTSTWAPSDALYATLFPGGKLTPAPSHPLQFNIEHLALPSLSGISKMSMRATLQTSLLSYKKAFAFSPYVIENLSSDIVISSFDDIGITMESSLFAFSFQGAFKEKESLLVCKKPISLTYLITDAQIQSLLQSDDRPYLQSPAPLRLVLQPGAIHLNADMISTLSISGTASLDDMILQNRDASKQTGLAKTALSFSFEGSSSLLQATLHSAIGKQSTTASSKIEASIKASSFLQNGMFELANAKVVSDVLLQDVPSSLVQMLSFQEIPLSLLIGPTFTLSAHVDTGPSSHELALDLKSLYMQLVAGLTIKDNIISSNKTPCHIDFTMTPQSYLALDSLITEDEIPPPFTLSEPTTFAVDVKELYVPYLIESCETGPQDSCLSIDLKNTQISASLTNKSLAFVDGSSKQAVLLKNAKASFLKMQNEAPITLQIAADAATKQMSGGTMLINAEISDIFSEKGQLDLSHISSKADINIQKLPSASLDLFARSFGSNPTTFSSLFGSSITATLSLALKDATGPIKMNINSPSTRASLTGKLTNGTLTLSEPIYAQITMTEELSTLLLGGVNPLSITEIRSKDPITLEVQPAGFSLPLTSFAISKVNIPNARIEIGQISCKNEGNLNIALGLLKSVQMSQNKTLNLWFTPIDLHINQGVVGVERTDILIAETFDIALWGLIDPVKNKVDMVLGLTADCLAKAFSITNIPEDYVLQIPMTGTLDKVEINKTKATAKIAALLAWQQAAIAGGAAGGPAGAVFGHFLNKLGSLPSNDQDTPPAKRPFPWESAEDIKPKSKPQKKKEASQRYKKTHIKKDEKPLKQIWKLVR